MWTDDQLIAQGWTQPQIEQWRLDQAVQTAEKEQTTVLENVTPPENIGSDIMTKSSVTGVLGSEKMQTILVACMMIVVPLTLYSSFIAEGPQGPQGDSGMQGENGTAGSSLHLVESSDDLPVCDSSIDNQIFFVVESYGFEVCQNNMWSEVNLTGQQGPSGMDGNPGSDGADGANGTDGNDGQDGANGADGSDGQNGVNGTDGSDGIDGLSSLIVSRVEAPGVNCVNGGTLIETGIDDNGDGVLSSPEVDDFVFVCNGNDGSDGADGANGSSTTTMLVARLGPAPAYLGCNGTGQLLQQGMDDGSGGGIAQNGILEAGEIITSTLICTTFSVGLVEDINLGTGGSNPSDFVTINSTIYFTANNGSTFGIWSLDVNDTLSLEYSGSAFGLRAIGGQIFFLGASTAHGNEPWIYDPSNGSGWMISDINSGPSGSFAGEFTLVGTTVYFAARDNINSVYDLWAYETVNLSLWEVETDIQPTSLIAVNSDLYFSAGPNSGNLELWKHETATNTTFMVKDINPGVLSSSPQHLVLMGTTLYMSANEGTTHGTELYAYDTTSNSTSLAADITPGFAGSSPSELAVLGDRVYFQATSGSFFEMWVYDSSNNSHWEITSFQSTSGSGGPHDLTVNGNLVFLAADDGSTGEELWAHSSINGTVWQVIDLDPTGGRIGDIHLHEGNIYFTGEDSPNDSEVWRLIFSRTVTAV